MNKRHRDRQGNRPSLPIKRSVNALATWVKSHAAAVVLGSYVLGVATGIATSVAGNYVYAILRPPVVSPLRNDDFRVRFAVISYSITPSVLARAPRLIHCSGTLGISQIQFDLSLDPTIMYGSSRGALPIPEIWYESEHVMIRTLEILNARGVLGEHLRFGLPSELREFVGPATDFEAELFVRNSWYPTGSSAFESGMVDIEITSNNQ